MDSNEKLFLIETRLERIAEQLGDITAPVMTLFYQRYPAIKAVFAELGCGDPVLLEAQMIENILYCFMVWFKAPAEIRILLAESAIHHLMTLSVALDVYTGLMTATWAEWFSRSLSARWLSRR